MHDYESDPPLRSRLRSRASIVARVLLLGLLAAACRATASDQTSPERSATGSGLASETTELPIETPRGPYVVVLGIAQDGGVPQAGTKDADTTVTDAAIRSLSRFGCRSTC